MTLKMTRSLRNLTFACISIFGYAYAQPAIQPFDMEVTTSMLKWKSGELSDRGIISSNALKNWKNDFAEDSFYFSELDVNGDKINEIIVAGSSFPARGRGYLLLQKQNNIWRDIARWRGGYIFHKKSKDVKKYDIHIFEKYYGEMYYIKAKLKGGKFTNDFVTLLPRTLYDSSFYETWQSLNSIDVSK
jgi:hypothetical protein